MALSKAAKTVRWMRHVLLELRNNHVSTIVFQDYLGCMQWATENSAKHFNRRKHIGDGYNFVRQLTKKGSIGLQFVPSNAMLADF